MKLRFSLRAKRDIAAILATIAGSNPKSVAAFDAAVDTAVQQIAQFPKAGRVVDPSSGMRSVVLRRWNYQLFYVEEAGDVVAVVTVRSARRRPFWPLTQNNPE